MSVFGKKVDETHTFAAGEVVVIDNIFVLHSNINLILVLALVCALRKLL